MNCYSKFASPAFLGDSGVVKVPCLVHHELKVLVIVNAHTDVVVVFNPFIKCDLSILRVSMLKDNIKE